MYYLFIAIAVVGLLSTSCSSSSTIKNDPTGTAWRVFQMGKTNLEKVDPSSLPTLSFDPAKHMVAGTTGCNRYSGSYDNDITALSFGNMAVTKMACDGERSAIESQFLDVLKRTSKMSVKDDVLMLMNANGEELLRARAYSGDK